jgi:hypothetical protein
LVGRFTFDAQLSSAFCSPTAIFNLFFAHSNTRFVRNSSQSQSLRTFFQIYGAVSSPLRIPQKIWSARRSKWRKLLEIWSSTAMSALNNREGQRLQKVSLLFKKPSFVGEPENFVEKIVDPKVLSDFVKIIQSEQIGVPAGNFRILRIFVRSLAVTNSAEFFRISASTVLVKPIFRFLKMP